jgi:replicative DNA helicase
MEDFELTPLNEDAVARVKKEIEQKLEAATVERAVESVIESLEKGEDSLIKLGIPELDYAIGDGLAFGEVLVIGARPSHGKSAIAMQMMHHVTQCGLPALIVSQEMSKEALGKRALQYISDVPQDDWQIHTDVLREEAKLHFKGRAKAYILETVPNVMELCKKAKEFQEHRGVRVVFVDYAQIVQGIGKSTYERVSHVSSMLRQLATESGLAIIVLAQLSREVEKRPEFRPSSKDLKDSGQLEQDADVIIFGVWPYKIDQTCERNRYQFLVDKNRNRAIRKHGFEVHFEPERQRYLDEMSKHISEFANDF